MTTTPRSQRLGRLLPELMGRLHGRVAGDALAIMHRSSLTLPQVIVLHVLRAYQVQSIGQLSSCLNLSASATSHLVDRLVDRKLVGRAEDPEDRRSKIVTLTAKGKKLVDRLAEARAKEIEAAIQTLDSKLQADLEHVLEMVLRALSTPPSR